MTYFQAIILSIVEGLTEFLPVSSTGHLILAAELLRIEQTDFVKSFEIFIQLGAISAVIWLYWKTLLDYRHVWLKIAFAFVPTAVVGLLGYQLIKDYLLGNVYVTLSALFLGGIALIIAELWIARRVTRPFLVRQLADEGPISRGEGATARNDRQVDKVVDLSLKQAFLIGVCQSLSVVPGVSRAAASIIGGMFVGADRKVAVEFSFLLAVPTMMAATGFDLLKSNFAFTENEYGLLAVGFVGAFVMALVAIKFMLRFVQANTFIPFGIYRIVLAVVFYWWMF